MFKRSLIAALLALAAITAGFAPASAAGKARTTLKCCSFFAGYTDPPRGAAQRGFTDCRAGLSGRECYVAGPIKSPKEECRDGRNVKLYRVRPGSDKRVGADETGFGIHLIWGEGYHFNVETRNPRYGEYYAKTGATGKCRSDRSKRFTFDKTTPTDGTG